MKISYPLLPILLFAANSAPAAITYVDAAPGNLARYDGVAFMPVTGGTAVADNNWEVRAFANGGTIYEANADGSEDAPMLLMTIGGLNPGITYNVFGYFWANTESWRLKASLDTTTTNSGVWPSSGDGNQNILDNGTPGDISDDFIDNDVAVSFSRNGTATSGAGLDLGPLDGDADGFDDSGRFTTAVMVAEGNRTLFEVSLGSIAANGSGEIVVLVDDLRDQTSTTNRTWFDGMGVEAVPEPSGVALALAAALGFVSRRRRPA